MSHQPTSSHGVMEGKGANNPHIKYALLFRSIFSNRLAVQSEWNNHE
jgi:hypothetical protein